MTEDNNYELTPEQITANLMVVRAGIAAACARTGRDPQSVQLCAVSKLKSAADIRAAMAAGQILFGENYVQEIQKKFEELGGIICEGTVSDGTSGGTPRVVGGEDPKKGEDLKTGALPSEDAPGQNDSSEAGSRIADPAGGAKQGAPVPLWHMIGHLQRNKVKYLIDKVGMIQSVDSLTLAQQIEKEAGKKNRVMDILLEVNVAQEESKWGFAASETIGAARTIAAFPHIRIRGLMTSAPYTEDAETNRIHFRNLKILFDELGGAGIPGVQADTLSMGMTGDYVVAVEEGATLVRVGTGIFGARDYGE